MVKASPFLAAFNAGEFSPRMDARVDFAKYENASSRALNLIALPQGGYTVRPGTRYVAELDSSAARGALYGFSPESGDSYILQFEASQLRFLKAQAQITVASTSTAFSNGTFAANITSWADRSTGSGAIVHSASEGGVMQITGTGNGYGWAEENLAIAGADDAKVHVVRFRISGAAGVKLTVQVGTTTLGYNLFQGSGYGIGWHTIEFTPGSGVTEVFVQFINKDNRSLFLDDVSVLSNTPLEITSPYPVGTIEELRIARSNDVLYLFHDAFQPYQLLRRGDRSWSLQKFFFEDGPWQEINPDIDLGDANLIENGIFEGGLQGWDAVITGDGHVEWDGAQQVTFLKNADGGGTAEIRQDVATGASAVLHVIHFQIVGGGYVTFKIGTTASGVDIVAATEYEAGWYTVSFTPGATPFHVTFARGTQDGSIVPGVGAVFCYNNRANLLQATAVTGNTTLTALGDFRPFRSTDVNRLVRLEHAGREPAWCVITAYTNDQTVSIRWFRDAASTEPTETHRLGAWSDTTGWPRVGTFFGQRLFAANTEDQPQTIWASVAGDFPAFRPDVWVEGATTVEDDNALSYTLASKEISPIRWMVGGRRLLLGTANGQWVVSSRGPALTPSDFNPEEQSFEKAADIEPAMAGNVVLFVDKSRKSIYDCAYSYEVDGLLAADLNVLADHMSGDGGFVQIAFQAKPYPMLWARKHGGKLACMIYRREGADNDIVGSTPVEIAGTSMVVESIAVVPGQVASGSQVYDSDDRDELWMIVKRTINGGTKRYIEVMEGFFSGPNRAEYESKSSWQSDMLTAQKDAVYVDSAVTYSGASTSSISVPHLEGQTVGGIANGVRITPVVVSAGAAAVSAGTTKAQIGLEYLPVYRSLKLPYGAQSGSSVAHTKGICRIGFVLLDACAFQYAVELDGFWTRRTASQHIDSNTLATGEFIYEDDGAWDSDPRVWIWPTPSLPFTMLGLAPRVTTNEQ